MTTQSLTASIVQASPVYMDLPASLDKAAAFVEQAAGQGAQLVAFGETWLPGYPAWLDHCAEAALWDHAPTKEVFVRLVENSVTVPGEASDRLGKLAKAHGVVIVIGINERVETNGTLYNSILTFDADGSLANHHRKLVPTYTERLVWGQGDARGLRAVKTAAGRAGGLVCWEHWMPLPRQALHDQGEQVHVAVWPSVKEMHQIASRHYAFEGRCFVLAAGLLMPARDIPAELEIPPHLADDPDQLILNGGSAIIGPDGQYVAGPVFGDETVVTAELDLRAISREKMTLDTSGHYSRPDVFDFGVKNTS
jgi:predicted amidohydrolase